MTGLVINCIIGIFGIPGELNRLLGGASPISVIIAGLLMGSRLARLPTKLPLSSPSQAVLISTRGGHLGAL